MRKILCAFAFVASLFAAPAMAQECRPVSHFAIEAGQLQMEVEIVRESEKPGFIKAYNDELGLTLPPDSNPVGIFFAVSPRGVFVGLIEEGECIRYTLNVPLPPHMAAYLAASVGA